MECVLLIFLFNFSLSNFKKLYARFVKIKMFVYIKYGWRFDAIGRVWCSINSLNINFLGINSRAPTGLPIHLLGFNVVKNGMCEIPPSHINILPASYCIIN